MNVIPPKDSATPEQVATASPSVEPMKRPERPPARAAKLRRRHYGLMISFLLIVVIPLSVVVFYLLAVAKDQYGSFTGFTVRQEEGGSASSLLGGLASLTGATGSSDGDILYKFILSQALIQEVDDNIGLREHYGAFWQEDPIFALKPGASIEDMEQYWSRVVRVAYDQSSGLTEMRVQAFTPEKAREVATEILRLSQDMINALNEQAREDAMRYARSDLEEAVARLKASREGLTKFRSSNQIVDPESDIQGRMGVMNNLQQQLAQALIDLDLLAGTSSESDPRTRQAERLIEVIRARITSEREQLSSTGTQDGGTGDDYPRLIAEYEGLVVDREFAEENYRAALAALDLARANAQRQSRYLATYIAPTQAQTSEYPRHGVIIGMTTLFLLLGWSIMALVYYSVRDRS
ncbi:sugar transporter [Sulfitobacter sp.]|uniref:sugar transporter n=1 Tax=Sulfitobacter sp. TaxID=1903071 RepID=UPI003002B341